MAAKKPAKPKSHPLQDKIAAGDRQAIKRALKDPNLRKYVKDPAVVKKYAPKIAQQRALNTRLDAAVVPGSSMTERQLARSANLQGAVKYGPAEAELKTQTAQAQQQGRDVAGFYQQYLDKLAQNQQNVTNITGATAQGLQNVGQGITGLAASSLQSLQSAANADAAARGTTAGDLTKTASDAAATRQALLGSFQAQQQLVGAAQQTQASGLANVVGPGQKLQAVAQEAGKVRKLREKGLELATEKGTFTQQQREAGRADEAKNVLAKEIATGKSAADLAKAGLASKTTITTAKIRAKTAADQTAAAATQKQADRDAKTAADASKAHEPNKYGVPADRWAAWSTSHRQRVIDASKTKATTKDTATPGTPAYNKTYQQKYGVKPATTAAVNNAKSTIAQAKIWLGRIPGDTGAAGRLLTTGQAGSSKTGQESLAIPKLDPLFIRVAMDLKQYNGKISAGTANRLHRAGYSVPQLGLATVPTSTTTLVRPKKPAVTGSRGDTGR